MIESFRDVRAYFHERLTASLVKHNVSAEDPTRIYLVDMLAGFAGKPAENLLSRTLAEQLAEAVEAHGIDRLRKLRDLGNSSLYVAGFFSEHLDARGVSESYVATMGERAFLGCLSMVRHTAPPAEAALAGVYDALGHRFESYVKVLDDVREATALRTPQDIIRLYERWQRTRSPILAERLRAAGVFPAIEESMGSVN